MLHNFGIHLGDGVVLFQQVFSQGNNVIKDTWIILDSCSTCDVICNRVILKDIIAVMRGIYITYNAGKNIV